MAAVAILSDHGVDCTAKEDCFLREGQVARQSAAALPEHTLIQKGCKARWAGPSLSPTTMGELPSESNRLLTSLPSSCTSSTLSASEAEREDSGANEMPDGQLDDLSAESDEEEEEAVDGLLPTSPSKSARRRIRRRRQAQAIKAAAEHARGSSWGFEEPHRASRSVVTLEDIGLGLLSPAGGGSCSSSTAQVASGEIQTQTSPVAIRPTVASTPCGGHASSPAAVTVADVLCMGSHIATPCRSTWTAPLGTSPCEAAPIQGDAADRVPQTQSLAYAYTAPPVMLGTPLATEQQATTAHALRVLFGNVLEAQLRVAAPDIYED